MKITLVNPPPIKIIESHDAPPSPSLALGYIGAFLRSRGQDFDAVDAKFEKLNLADVEVRLQQQKPDVVGITAMTHEIIQASKVAEFVKVALPGALTVIGGAHATALPRETMEQFPHFDYLVFGEGEYTFYELISALQSNKDLTQVRGICYRLSNQINITEPRELNENLDGLPFPAWDKFPKANTYSIIATRGCPFRCNFCMRVLGDKVRARSPQNVVAEIQHDLEVLGAVMFNFNDETFGINKKYAYELLNLIIDKELNRTIKWCTQTRVDLADYELFRKMKDAGCFLLGFGVESGNEQILEASKKRISLAQATEAIKLAKNAGLKTGGYFIIGHPFETHKTARDTINFATKLNTSTVAFGIMVPYPGTEIYQMATSGQGGYKIISSSWNDFNKTIGNSLELKSLSRSELEKLELLGYLKFYLFNLRIVDLIKLFIHQKGVVFSAIKKLIRR